MIELRYVSDFSNSGELQQVLQYRQAIWYLGADGNLHPARSETGGFLMGEWMDVQTP